MTLMISHYLYLSHTERYALVSGKTIEVVGVSVPVWFHKGSTSEPAVEVFCEYVLSNDNQDFPVTPFIKGYKINLPQMLVGHKVAARPKPNVWDNMTIDEQERWERLHPQPPLTKDLLDAEDGGLGGLRFKKYSKIREPDKQFNMIHNIEISSMGKLLSSFSC